MIKQFEKITKKKYAYKLNPSKRPKSKNCFCLNLLYRTKSDLLPKSKLDLTKFIIINNGKNISVNNIIDS